MAWPDLVAVLAETHGGAAAAWLRDAIERPGTATLELAEADFAADRVRAVIVQPAPAWHGLVEIAAQRCDAAEPPRCSTVATYVVTLAGERTPIELALPPGADRIVLDDDVRFPRRLTSRVGRPDAPPRALTTTARRAR